MKRFIPYSLIAAALACGLASAQTTAYTTPVGYTTQTLGANMFNVVGFNVLAPTLVSSVLTGVSGATLTDSTVNFTTLFTAGKTYVLDIKDGTAAGTVQEFITWSGSNITLPSAVAGVAIGNKYSIRIAPTLQEVFPLGFLTGSATAANADKVWVPNGSGGYTKYYNRITIAPTGWRTTTTGSNDTGAVTGDIPLVYTDSVLVEKKGVANSVVLSGEVKTTASSSLLVVGFNPISIVSPTGLTLFTSGLQAGLTGSATAANADKVWVPNGSGGYTKYYNRITIAPTGWRITTTGSNDTGAAVDVPLTGGVFIERKGSAKVVSLSVPSSYSSL